MKNTILIGMLTFCVTTITYGQVVPGVPEPGVLLYGKIFAVDGVTTIPATAVNLHVRATGGTVIPLTTDVISSNGIHYYVARIPFESVLSGLEDTSSNNIDAMDEGYQLEPDSVQFDSSTDNAVAPLDNADSIPTFAFGSNNLRGQLFRIDIQTQFDTAGLPNYDSWAASHFGEDIGSTGVGAITADPDRDTFTNEQEWLFRTDPTNTDPDKRLHQTVIDVESVYEQPTHMSIRISPKWNDGRVYVVTKSTDLREDSWHVPNPPISIVDTAPIGATGAFEAVATDTLANEEAAFYRIEVTLPAQASSE